MSIYNRDEINRLVERNKKIYDDCQELLKINPGGNMHRKKIKVIHNLAKKYYLGYATIYEIVKREERKNNIQDNKKKTIDMLTNFTKEDLRTIIREEIEEALKRHTKKRIIF